MMMRHVVAAAIGALVLIGCGRLVKVPDEERIVRRVSEVGLSKNDIYDRALEWCASRFSTAREDVIVRDREKGKIIAKGAGKYSEYFDFLVDREFTFTVTIEIKDGRYRVTFDNLTVYYDEREVRSSRAAYKFEINKIRKKLEALMDNLHEALSKGTLDKDKEKGKDDEW